MTVTLHGPDGQPRASSAAAPVETPSEQVVRKANEPREVTDARGRRIKFKKLGALETMDLNELAGGANAMNAGWMMFATIAYAVVEIDGERVMRPTTKQQLRALVQRLGDEGIDAVFAAVQPEQEDEPQADAESEAHDRAKNS